MFRILLAIWLGIWLALGFGYMVSDKIPDIISDRDGDPIRIKVNY